ncbi:hypothetical protein ACERK3_05745 [Phycisphaerales bacterium AB-hyl4]|uniref:Uncharacterized protein n=1 Tax=Natronomicrosphaera hydrolytica TaxID=3242702 RepID=A0ABV4U2I2_9BACT
MNVREWLNNNSAVVTIVAVLVLCFALAFIIWNNTPTRPGPIDIYFVDLNTGELFVGKNNEHPPIQAPSDNEGEYNGVRIHMYSCGDCPSRLQGRSVEDLASDGVFVAYYERYTDEARQALQRDMTESSPEDEMRYYEVIEMGQLVRSPERTEWVSINSEAGYRLMSRFGDRCDRGDTPSICRP